MPTIAETVASIVGAATLDERVAQIRLIPQRHGTGEHPAIYAAVARQVLDATSVQRGDLIEDAVEALFKENGIPHVRTGGHNQGDIEARFGVLVTPAPDFVVFDESDTLRAMLECKGANDGGMLCAQTAEVTAPIPNKNWCSPVTTWTNGTGTTATSAASSSRTTGQGRIRTPAAPATASG